MKKFILYIIFIFTFAFAEDNITSNIYLAPVQEELDGCYMHCPEVKDEFITRYKSFEYETGKTTCFVYSIQQPHIALSEVGYISPACPQELLQEKTSENDATIQTLIEQNKISDQLDDLKADFERYTDTGTQEFLNMPKYLLAGLLVDEEIIDIRNSISQNEVVLNPDYTVNPNLLTQNSENETVLLHYHTNEFISKIKVALSDVVVYILDFLSLNNEIMVKLKVFLFFLIVPLSVTAVIAGKITRKISNVSDFEDITERVVVGLSIVFIFFFSHTKIETNESNISQVSFHSIIRPLFYKASSAADLMTQNALEATLHQKASQAGLSAIKDLKYLSSYKQLLEKKQEANRLILNQCSIYYDTEELKRVNSGLGINTIFPPSETVTDRNYRLGEEKSFKVEYYGASNFRDPSYVTRSRVPSVSLCFNTQRTFIENKSALQVIEQKLEKYQTALQNKELKDQFSTLTKIMYQNQAELGWLNIASLGLTSVAFDQLEIFKPNSTEEQFEDIMDVYRKESGYEISDVASGSTLGAPLNSILSNLPYLMLPGADSVKQAYRSILPSIDGKDRNEKDNSILSRIADFVMDKVSNKFPALTILKFGTEIAIIVLTIMTMVIFVTYLPLIVIATASFGVISFYYLSVEIIYLAIPFIAVFAFASGNTEILKNIIKNIFILALKPIMIVISVILALIVFRLFESFNTVLISSMFEPVFYLLNSQSPSVENPMGLVSFGQNGIMTLIQGLIHLASSIFASIVCFYLVINGSNIILDFFGLRENGFDVQNVIGDRVSQKTSRLDTMI